ncbi:hypothetical protein ACFQFS_10920 [Novosphingobium lubricantis]|jgi:hypothetical protein
MDSKGAAIRMDPVKIRVALPAADPPDNSTPSACPLRRAARALRHGVELK